VGPLLASTLDSIGTSVYDLRRILDVVAADHAVPQTEVSQLTNKLELTRVALRETVYWPHETGPRL